ncbi:MAG: branched-chain amino acid ABC transporter permease, partial [Chloroflexi bacterium]|nr:branched-chain amino acid ABC transporter permease [Chloroflexota bacterium]
MADILLQGLFVGGLYALIALGFAMIYKSSMVMNLAYGEQILIGSYVLYWLLNSMGLPTWAAILIVFAMGAALGLVLERAFIRPLMGQSFLAILMMTLMLGYLFKGIAVLLWGGQSFSFPFAPSGMITLGGVQILPAAMYAFLTALGVFGVMLFVFRYTKVGLAMRVVAYDHLVSQSLGIKVKSIFSISW